MKYYLIRLLLAFALSITTPKDCFSNNSQPLLKVIDELCTDLPNGIYTLSIVQTDYTYDDKNGVIPKFELNFGARSCKYSHLYNHLEYNTRKRLLDYYCLLDNSFSSTLANTISSSDSTNYKYSIETEQTISGYVKSTFKKVDNFILKLLIPYTGEQHDLKVQSNRFILHGLDFCDGTIFTLQATKTNGSDNLLELYIDTLDFPNVSVRKYHYPFLNNVQLETTKKYISHNLTNINFDKTIILPDVVAKGRFKPINRLNVDPDRTIKENDPIFEKVQTIERLVYHFGLRRGHGYIDSGNDELIYIEALGNIRKGTFVPCEVMLDDNLVSGYALTDILNINPLDIKQIEYFLPSNYEMFGNLAGSGGSKPINGLYGNASKRGLLMIWTKSPTSFSRFKRDKPFSVANVKQLGYMTQQTFSTHNTDALNPTTVFWDPHFTPHNIDVKVLENIRLTFSIDYTITIEGISNEGVLINKQKHIKL